jgi:hypothetical protein
VPLDLHGDPANASEGLRIHKVFQVKMDDIA